VGELSSILKNAVPSLPQLATTGPNDHTLVYDADTVYHEPLTAGDSRQPRLEALGERHLQHGRREAAGAMPLSAPSAPRGLLLVISQTVRLCSAIQGVQGQTGRHEPSLAPRRDTRSINGAAREQAHG